MNENKKIFLGAVTAILVVIFGFMYSSDLNFFQGSLLNVGLDISEEELVSSCNELQFVIDGLILEGLYVTPRLSASETELRNLCESQISGLLRINGPNSNDIEAFYERMNDEMPLLSFEEKLETYQLDVWELALSCDAFFDGYDTFYASAEENAELQAKFLETQMNCKEHPEFAARNLGASLTARQCEVLNRAYENQISSTTLSYALYRYGISIDQVLSCRI